jgi:hypothetical protein
VSTEFDAAKQQIRDWMWHVLERKRAAEAGGHGYIRALEAADAAADQLAVCR